MKGGKLQSIESGEIVIAVFVDYWHNNYPPTIQEKRRYNRFKHQYLFLSWQTNTAREATIAILLISYTNIILNTSFLTPVQLVAIYQISIPKLVYIKIAIIIYGDIYR